MNGPTVRWEGLRGEAYVMIQVALLVMLVFGPRTVAGLPPWPAEAALPALIGGIALMAAGGLIAALGALRLGSNLTPLPHPKDGATLVVSGLYARVRHPIYLGLILSAFGWALFHQGWLTLGWAALLFVLLDVKSRREERWLADRFPAYADYRRRTRRLIPWLY
ncbi:MAG TPA: isoprenylcysteine carboxylmethyltransferase family protein [Zoogloea sp.]|uniref:methyltransferase family protein n=1 Tax=Zoogloea sp. TaxID=49181 RepID=UPI002C2BDDA7|nr:isoprenylcysteine carboxylmethyltransferase family protein [Zoogloea sp.]HMV18367.1 isoprenylcysteine carboxylmethyltransferase family protein [Rhodocyclaceae bacterium]HMV62443.1 isoprenylcysteine carboxylmethyltransferase family protein [Rhodocyclaceae bacterium]HMW52666.1 isoprenylcysteine carboxylmethyltransferase family protein [Rhodocyclaceae bacterium]HMY50546.1 isoprenylcysteine carboxylmethyltransferase family protein [Rhodocyclaceae bacterium]HMZ77102.1 isoprenylcysteine carboxylm